MFFSSPAAMAASARSFDQRAEAFGQLFAT
jgi:hypothetical protein